VALPSTDMAKKRLTREDKRAANRARILQAARKVFGRRGYHAATIEEIADEAGLSNGAFYYNFENKEDLFLELLEQWRAELIRDVEIVFAEAGRRGDRPEEQLEDELRQILRALGPSRDWQLLLLEFVSYAARNPRFRRRFVAGRQVFKRSLTAALEQRIRALGLEPAAPPEQLTLLLTALVNGLAVDQLTEPGSLPDELLGNAVTALMRPH
jgi:AcrR family transcriptional regulator